MGWQDTIQDDPSDSAAAASTSWKDTIQDTSAPAAQQSYIKNVQDVQGEAGKGIKKDIGNIADKLDFFGQDSPYAGDALYDYAKGQEPGVGESTAGLVGNTLRAGVLSPVEGALRPTTQQMMLDKGKTVEQGNQLASDVANLGIVAAPFAGDVIGAANKAADLTETNNSKNIFANNTSSVSPNAATAGITGIPKGVANRVKGALGTMSPDELENASDKNWQSANDSFKSSRSAGATLNQVAQDNILNNVKDSVNKAGILNPSRHSDTVAAIGDLEDDVNNGTLTLEKLDQHRQSFGDAIKDNTSKIDGTNSDGYRAVQGKNAIVDSISNLKNGDFTSGSPQAATDLLTGINQYAKAARFDKVSDIINKSGGDPNAIKRNLTNFVNNLKKNSLGFTQNEIDSLSDAASRSPGELLERGLGSFGWDFGKAKNVVLPAITSGASTLVPGAGPTAAIGTVLRQTGKYAARGKAQNALDLINSRDTTPKIPEKYGYSPLPEQKALSAPPQYTVDLNGNVKKQYKSGGAVSPSEAKVGEKYMVKFPTSSGKERATFHGIKDGRLPRVKLVMEDGRKLSPLLSKTIIYS